MARRWIQLGLALALALSPLAVAPRAAHAALPALGVSGNRLTAGGVPVTLRGVNRSGTEYACIQGWGIFDGPSDAASVQAIASWHATLVRVLVNEDCWLGINGVDPRYGGSSYRQALVDYVNLLHGAGLYAEVSLIWAAPGGYAATYQPNAPDADHSPATWASLAATFSGDGGVVLAPWGETTVGWACFRDGCSDQATFGPSNAFYATAGMQQAVTVIRQAGFGGPIAIPCIDFANDCADGGGSWLQYEPSDPLHELVAEAHVYGNNTCGAQSAGSCLTATMAPLAASVPLLFGETGESYDDSECSAANMQVILPWADQHNVSWEAWTWDTWGTCLSLVTDYGGTPNSSTPPGAGYASYVRQHLLGYGTAPPPPPTRGPYHPLTPTRILDTRTGNGTGGAVGRLAPGGYLVLAVGGRGGVAADAAAVALNLTAADAGGPTYLTVFPTGQPLPLASNLNVGRGQQVANLVQVQLGSLGQVTVYNDLAGAPVDVIADVEGWVAAAPDGTGAGLLLPLASPTRLLDTRPGYSPGSIYPHPLAAGGTITLPIPQAAAAVAINLTAVGSTAPGYLAVDASPGSASTVNYGAGDTRANAAFAAVSAGAITIYNGGPGSVDVLVDETGYFTTAGGAAGYLYSPRSPARLLDTRSTAGYHALGPGESLALNTGSAAAVAVNLTVTDVTAWTYLAVDAGGTGPPAISNLNAGPGATMANLVVTATAGGTIRIYNSRGTVDVVVDLQGTYS